MKDRNWSYLAGLFDGEGCIHIAEVRFKDGGIGYRLDIHITMTNLEVIKWLVAHFGGVYYTREVDNPRWNTAYRWVPKGKANKETLLLGMLPYLIVKKNASNIGLEFLRLEGQCPEKRRTLCLASRKFTSRGKSLETNTLGSKEMIESELAGNSKSEIAVMQLS